MHTYHPGANITRVVGGAALLCLCSAVAHGQDSQTFVIHGTSKSCSSITQLDSALSSSSQQFFAGWTQKDYADALAWSQACADYGWHVPGRPRIPLLQAQYAQAMGSAQTQNGSSAVAAGASGSAAAGGVTLAQAQTTSSAAPQPQMISSIATGSAVPIPAVQTEIPAQAQAASGGAATSSGAVPTVREAIPVQAETASIPAQAQAASFPGQVASAAETGNAAAVSTVREAIPAQAGTASTAVQAQTASLEATGAGSALPVPAVGAMVPIPSQTSGAGAAGVIPSAPVSAHSAAPEDADSLLTDDYFKKHFHQESLWVATKANLDIGEDRGPANWTSNGTSAQLKNRLTADRIVLYCAKKTNSRESDNRPLFWDWRWCETEEASAYSRLVSGNEFPAAGRSVLLGCADVESYIYLERCVQTLSEAQRQ
jgi:hypothetical protein